MMMLAWHDDGHGGSGEELLNDVDCIIIMIPFPNVDVSSLPSSLPSLLPSACSPWQDTGLVHVALQSPTSTTPEAGAAAPLSAKPPCLHSSRHVYDQTLTQIRRSVGLLAFAAAGAGAAGVISGIGP